MINQYWRHWFVAFALVLLPACVSTSIAPIGMYTTAGKEHLYRLKAWRLAGRIAVFAVKESWSANIDWQHWPDTEKLKLSGPLGQGAVAVNLTGEGVSIDRGDGRVQTSNEPGRFINQQLGIEVPLRSLSFWAVGLPEPGLAFQGTADGFVQSGWLVDYKSMQKLGNEVLPQKLTVTNQRVKLKLVVDEWKLNDNLLN